MVFEVEVSFCTNMMDHHAPMPSWKVLTSKLNGEVWPQWSVTPPESRGGSRSINQTRYEIIDKDLNVDLDSIVIRVACDSV